MNMHVAVPPLEAPPGAGDVEDYVRCPPGEIVTGLRRGDLLFIHNTTLLSRAIRLFAWMRFRKDDLRHGYWSHVAMVVSDFDHVVDVDTGGVDLCHIREYRKVDVCCVRLRLDLAARDAVSLYARQYVGQSYDVKGFLWLALSVLLGDRLRVPDTGKPGCTSLVVRALERGGLRFDRPAPEMMPADLAKKFGVLP